MRLLLIGKKIASKEDIRSFSEMQNYYIGLSLRKIGVEIIQRDYLFNEDPDFIKNFYLSAAVDNNVDYILASGVRYFTQIDKSVGEYLAKKFRGTVAQLHDSSLLDGFPVDVNLTLRDDSDYYRADSIQRFERHSKYNKYVGWAASNELFYPEQIDNDVLRVFVDHPTFHYVSFDHSLNIFMALKSLKKMIESTGWGRFKKIVVKTLTDEGIQEVDLNNFCVKPYARTSVPAEKFAQELRGSHIFCVTHKESLGLSVLESAMCGCYILIPHGCIPDSLSGIVRSQVFSGNINWDSILENIRPDINSAYVQKYSWDALANNIVARLIDSKKRYLS